MRLGDLEALQGVVKFPVRIKCATLAWNTLQQGLDEATKTQAREPIECTFAAGWRLVAPFERFVVFREPDAHIWTLH